MPPSHSICRKDQRVIVSELRRWLGNQWRTVRRNWFFRKHFRNAAELERSFSAKTACDQALCRDGSVIRHPAGRTGLAPMILEVWRDQVYTGSFYQPKPGDTILDAGANIGLLSLWLARQCPACHILAFEPFAENYQLLCQNLASAAAEPAVRAFPLALTGQSGTGTMIDGGNRSQDHRLQALTGANAPASANAPVGVKTCTLQEVIELAGVSEIALFKCDIEGSEQDLFRHVQPNVLRRIRRLAVEYHDNLCPGTLDILQERLRATHDVTVHPAPAGYGMLYAVRRA
jgi:FkbM family methyltransferase